VLIAAQAIGWNYQTLLRNMLAQAQKVKDVIPSSTEN
jgi:hypothetical protein